MSYEAALIREMHGWIKQIKDDIRKMKGQLNEIEKKVKLV